MIEAIFNNGNVEMVGNFAQWLELLEVSKHVKINWYAGLLKDDDYDNAIKELDLLDIQISKRLIEVINIAEKQNVTEIILD